MSDTERLEAAADTLGWRADIAERAAGHVSWVSSAAEDRAVAALLRSVVAQEATGWGTPGCIYDPALAVADAVLGVPVSPKEQTPREA